MNISEANDVALVLQHMTRTTNTDRDPVDVALAANRLAGRAGKTLQYPAWAIATPEEIEEAVVFLAQAQADGL